MLTTIGTYRFRYLLMVSADVSRNRPLEHKVRSRSPQTLYITIQFFNTPKYFRCIYIYIYIYIYNVTSVMDFELDNDGTEPSKHRSVLMSHLFILFCKTLCLENHVQQQRFLGI